jgi:hypothetical protein
MPYKNEGGDAHKPLGGWPKMALRKRRATRDGRSEASHRGPTEHQKQGENQPLRDGECRSLGVRRKGGQDRDLLKELREHKTFR